MIESLRRLSLCAALCGLLGLAATAVQAQTATYQFDLPAQPLADALRAVGRQTSKNILFDPALVEGISVPALRAELTVSDAVKQLLAGTKLSTQEIASDTVLIRNGTRDAAKKPVASKTTTVQGTNGYMHLAQAETNSSAQSMRSGSQDSAGDNSSRASEEAEKSRIVLEEIVVTGTHIAGSKSAGSRVITLDREYIAKSGYATVEGLLKTLPQNFGGGVAQGQSRNLITDDTGNFNEGTAINLRGLGADSTLILIDGRRQPGSGINGAFVDVSSIPTSAIERVEILPDGASALYGSDAVGGVVNFILRKDLDGAESQVRFGTAEGGADQVQVSQLFGHSWATGNAILGYQYDDRHNLPRNQRAYSTSDDLQPLGGSDYRTNSSNPGNILTPGTFQPAFAIPQGQDGTSLQASDLLPGVINYDTSSSAADLFGDQEMHSAFLNATQRFGQRVEVFANGRFATRRTNRALPAQASVLAVPSSNPFFVDPFGGSNVVFVSYNFSDDLGLLTSAGEVDTYVGTVGATVELPADWQVSFSGTYGREETVSRTSNFANTGALNSALADSNPATAFNPFADGSSTPASTLAAIRATSVNTIDSVARNGNVILTGPLFRVGESSSMLALGLDYRDDDLSTQRSSLGLESKVTRGRQVKAAFAEIALPLVTSGSYPALRELSLSLAGRYEDYSDFGTTFNERAGVTWAPVESLKVRTTWGSSFKAPRLNQLDTAFPQAFDFFRPLPSPGGTVNSLVRFGNNPSLTEETADVWSAGIEWTPAVLPSFEASLTYWRIDYEDRIAAAGPTGNPFSVLFEADEWADAINFDPTRAQIDSICRSPSFSWAGNPITVDQCLALTPEAVIDLRLTNLALVKVEGVDVEGRYRFDTRAGAITLGVNGVYMPSYDRQVTRNSTEVDVSNTTGNVLRLRLRGEASWSHRGWDVGAFVNYANSYDDAFSVSDQSIDAWTTVDGTVSYRFQDEGSALHGLTVALYALNIFDEDPPFANVGTTNYAFGYDTANADSYGRVLSLQVSKVWGR